MVKSTPVPPHVTKAISAASDIWSASNGWLQILEEALGGLEAGRSVPLEDKAARRRLVAAIAASPWSSELSTHFDTFDKASSFVQTWTTEVHPTDLPPKGTGGAYLRMAVRDARTALGQSAGFLFARLQRVTEEDGNADRR
jgi:hypothetical protein